MTTKQQCPVQGWTWKSVPELSTNPQLPNQFFPLHNHYVSALYTISISHLSCCPSNCKNNLLLTVCLNLLRCLSFSLFKTVTIENGAFFRQNQDTCIQCLSPFLDSQWKIKGGLSSAWWQLGAKLLLESTQSLAPEQKLWNIFICSIKGAAAMKWHLRQNNLVCRWCHRMAPSIHRVSGNIVPAPQSN